MPVLLVEFTPSAERDLRQIALHISAENPQRAITFALELRAQAKALGDFAERFEQVATRQSEPVRRRVYRNYVIFYRHNSERVAILRIVHGAKVTDEFVDNQA